MKVPHYYEIYRPNKKKQCSSDQGCINQPYWRGLLEHGDLQAVCANNILHCILFSSWLPERNSVELSGWLEAAGVTLYCKSRWIGGCRGGICGAVAGGPIYKCHCLHLGNHIKLSLSLVHMHISVQTVTQAPDLLPW